MRKVQNLSEEPIEFNKKLNSKILILNDNLFSYRE